MEKHLKTTIIVSVIVALVVSLLTFFVAKNVLLAPAQFYPQQVNVNARRCQADGVCEVSSLSSTGVISSETMTESFAFRIMNPSTGQVGQMSQTGIADGNHLSFSTVGNRSFKFITDYGNIARIDTEGNFFAEDINVDEVKAGDIIGASIIASANSNQQVIINPFVEYPIRADSYEGNGTAYACINSNGNIFRSQTPCV